MQERRRRKEEQAANGTSYWDQVWGAEELGEGEGEGEGGDTTEGGNPSGIQSTSDEEDEEKMKREVVVVERWIDGDVPNKAQLKQQEMAAKQHMIQPNKHVGRRSCQVHLFVYNTLAQVSTRNWTR